MAGAVVSRFGAGYCSQCTLTLCGLRDAWPVVLQVLSDAGHLYAVTEAAYTALGRQDTNQGRRLQNILLLPMARLAAIVRAVTEVSCSSKHFMGSTSL